MAERTSHAHFGLWSLGFLWSLDWSLEFCQSSAEAARPRPQFGAFDYAGEGIKVAAILLHNALRGDCGRAMAENEALEQAPTIVGQRLF